MRPNSNVRFWQFLLAMELPFAKSSSLLRTIPDSLSEDEAIAKLLQAPQLSSSELERAKLSKASELERAVAKGAAILSLENMAPRLQAAAAPMPALFVRGDPSCLDAPTLGIVGTRGATTYGKACAMKFAEAVASSGITVISGGAFGIDAAAHEGALSGAGKTVAVLPCGIETNYPAAHRGLFETITANGCLVSQFACGYKLRNDSFLARNYTIAWLADAVLIVESPERSGALHTANRANELGKPVYVIPGSISQPSFHGSHDLIRQGATLVDHPQQILDDYHIYGGLAKAPTGTLTELQSQILDQLSSEPISPEKLIGILAIDPSEVLSELTMLEIEGRIIRASGGVCLAP